ncbi:MAG: purine-binding chemotaxis protein CheW [Clostridiaceae bacterium]|nr:purine-binding chemotaxis protein CheW [Clostridiaceae bacterium]
MSDIYNNHIYEDDTQEDRYLTFFLDKDIYGIEIKYINEIIGMQKITKIPEVPHYAKGVINLRGKIVPVIDLRLKFKKEEIEYNDRTCIIIVSVEDLLVGLIVDNVDEVAKIPKENIAAPPDYKVGFHNRYIKGIGKTEDTDTVKLLLDCEKILTDDEFEEISQMRDKA